MSFLTSLLHASLVLAAPLPVAPVISATALVAPAAAYSFAGFWMQEDQAVIEIARQGTAQVYAGRYVAFRHPATTAAHKKLIGSSILTNLTPAGEKLTGNVLDPDSGKEYKVELVPTGPNTLEMRVKVMGMVARKITWQRQASATN